MAIEHALMILGWHQNLAPDEVPPKHIWADGDGLDEWWERVKARREARTGSYGHYSSSGADDELVDNELARAFKGK